MAMPDLPDTGHDHGFGVDQPRPDEKRSIVVVGISAMMMVIEIIATAA